MDRQASDTEMPRHPVTFARPFRMAAHKTTQAQFQEVMKRNPSWFSATGGGKQQVAGMDTTRFPVENVTYFDAVEFCNKLSQKENRRPCYRVVGAQRGADGSISSADVELSNDGTGYRLPSEAEWEYCTRAGTSTRYWFGDDALQLSAHAWFAADSGGRTHPVGEKKPNPWQLYDMGGLVNEWCDDAWHDRYQGGPTDGSAWRAGGEQGRRVLRGGSWYSIAWNCRCAVRDSSFADHHDRTVGFRVVLVAP